MGQVALIAARREISAASTPGGSGGDGDGGAVPLTMPQSLLLSAQIANHPVQSALSRGQADGEPALSLRCRSAWLQYPLLRARPCSAASSAAQRSSLP